MLKFEKIISIIGILVFAMISSCREEKQNPDGDDHGLDRSKMLAFYADSIILPAYDSFQIELKDLKLEIDSFTATPTTNGLNSLRTAWINAYIQWQTVELFDFGPAELQTLRNFYNIYPADTSGISGNINNPAAGLEVPATYPQQGFPALDYLINGVASNDADILKYYTHGIMGSKRLSYLKRLSDRMNELFQIVISEWKGSYRDKFVSKTGLDVSSSTSLMVNGIILHYERFLRSGKIGIPSGAMASGTPAPEKVEAYYKRDISRILSQSAHNAYSRFFNGKSVINGKEGFSIRSYLDALNAKDNVSGKMLSQIINEQFTMVDNGLKTLNADFTLQISTDNEAMKQVYNQMQAAVRMLKVDMSSAMSITITFTDNDGD